MPGQRAYEAFQVLSGGRQMKLLGDIPDPAQPHATEPHLLFEFGKQGFDAIARSACPSIVRRVREGADRLPGRLVSMDEELAVAP